MNDHLKKDSIGHIIKVKDYAPRLEQHEIIRRYITILPGDRLLDIGCGLGEFLESVEGSLGLGIGIDVDIDCLRECKRLLVRSGLLRADAAYLPFADGSFDLVIASGVIEHLDNPTLFLRETRRICCRMCVFMTPNIGRPSRLIAAAQGRMRYERSGHKQGWDCHLFNQVLERTGWKVERIETRFVDFPLYGLFPRRFSRWMSYVVLQRLFPKVGSELFAFCLAK